MTTHSQLPNLDQKLRSAVGRWRFQCYQPQVVSNFWNLQNTITMASVAINQAIIPIERKKLKSKGKIDGLCCGNFIGRFAEVTTESTCSSDSAVQTLLVKRLVETGCWEAD